MIKPSKVQVRGETGVYTLVLVGTRAIACTCPHYVHRLSKTGKACKHMAWCNSEPGQEALQRFLCAERVAYCGSCGNAMLPHPTGLCGACRDCPVPDNIPLDWVKS